jgi:hypothetical protein
MHVTTLIAAAALLVAAISTVISVRSLREVRKANALAATIEFFREYRSEQMVADRRLVLSTVRKIKNSDKGITDMPNDVARAALRLCHYLDNLGVLMANGLFPADIATGFLGVTAVQLWSGLRPFIEVERRRRPGRLYLEHFEHLAVLLDEIDVTRVRGRLRTWDDRVRLRGQWTSR